MTAHLQDDRVLPETRAAAVLVTLVLVAAGVTLYVWPADTEELFAWPIRPAMTPLFMGAGYLLGSYFWARAIFAARWHHVGAVLVPITLFAWMMLIATVLHWDRFNHSHPWFYVWVGIYVVTPFLVPVLWLRNRRTDPGAPDPDDPQMPGGLRLFLAIGGAAQLVLGLALFLVPEVFIGIWPWLLTPLTARVIGGWYATAGLTGLVTSRDPRWSTSRILFQGSIAWLALLLLAVGRARSDLDPANPLTWAYIGSLVIFLAVTVGFYATLERERWRKSRRGLP